ncbi:MAG TPA: hypothetical protein PLB25_12035 [Rhodoferax sp.]|nr:hypothetical protein [Rhodoferax sp.]
MTTPQTAPVCCRGNGTGCSPATLPGALMVHPMPVKKRIDTLSTLALLT